MHAVRITVILDPDAEALAKRAMRERGLTFKQAVNEAIRAGSGIATEADNVSFPTYDMGEAVVDITKALRLAGEIEDQELTGRLARGT